MRIRGIGASWALIQLQLPKNKVRAIRLAAGKLCNDIEEATFMSDDDKQSLRIDGIPTELSGVLRAIGRPVPAPRADDPPELQDRLANARVQQLHAREMFLKRYQSAIHAYIATILRQHDAVSAVWDSFVDKWLNGKLSGYEPEQGEFRKYLKTVLRNDCRAYWIQARKTDHSQRLDTSYEDQLELQASASAAFDRELQQDILRSAQHAILAKDPRCHELIMFLSENENGGQTSSQQVADFLYARTGKEITVSHARQLKHRAREMYTHQIIVQVSLLLDTHSLPEIEETLSDLGLLRFCRTTLQSLKSI